MRTSALNVSICVLCGYKCSADLRASIHQLFKEKSADIVKTDDWMMAQKSGSHLELLTELYEL